MLAAHNMAETNITMPFLSVLSTINPASTLNKSPNIKGSADIQPTFAHEKPRSVFKYVGSQVTTPHDSMELEEKTANKIQKLELHRYTLARSTIEIFSLLFLCKTSSVVLLLIFWSSRTLTYLFSCGKFDVKK